MTGHGELGRQAGAVERPELPDVQAQCLSLHGHVGDGLAEVVKRELGVLPMYDILDGVVYLGGALWNTTQNAQGVFAVLPPAARPADALYLNVNPGSVLRIDPDGTMQLFSGAAGYDPAHYTSLGGLSYHLGS